MVTTVPKAKGSGGKFTASFPTNDQAHADIVRKFATCSLARKTQGSNHSIYTGLYAIVNHALHGMRTTLLLLVTAMINGDGSTEVETCTATTSNADAMAKIILVS